MAYDPNTDSHVEGTSVDFTDVRSGVFNGQHGRVPNMTMEGAAIVFATARYLGFTTEQMTLEEAFATLNMNSSGNVIGVSID